MDAVPLRDNLLFFQGDGGCIFCIIVVFNQHSQWVKTGRSLLA